MMTSFLAFEMFSNSQVLHSVSPYLKPDLNRDAFSEGLWNFRSFLLATLLAVQRLGSTHKLPFMTTQAMSKAWVQEQSAQESSSERSNLKMSEQRCVYGPVKEHIRNLLPINCVEVRQFWS
jgi:hypothetical protein